MTRCRFCSGLILPDHQPRHEPTHHSRCFIKQQEIEEKLGRTLSDTELARRAANAREEYVLEQLSLVNELPWEYRVIWAGAGVSATPGDMIPDFGLDQIERKMDILDRVSRLPNDEKKVIKGLYVFGGEIGVVAKALKMTKQVVDRTRNRAVKRLGEMVQ